VSERPPLKLVEPLPPGWPEWMEQWLLPYLREPVLWPVLVALLGHVVVGLAPLMLVVWRTGNPTALVLLGLLSLGTAGLVGFEALRFHRPGAVTLTCALTWLSSGALAWLGERTGVL
jgi:hypothetical protein